MSRISKSAPIEFGLKVISHDSGQDLEYSSVFVRLTALDSAELKVALPFVTPAVGTLELFTRHPSGVVQVAYSQARWANIRFARSRFGPAV